MKHLKYLQLLKKLFHKGYIDEETMDEATRLSPFYKEILNELEGELNEKSMENKPKRKSRSLKFMLPGSSKRSGLLYKLCRLGFLDEENLKTSNSHLYEEILEYAKSEINRKLLEKMG
jgi:hypothetical protein